ncbi:hypothetical protein V502_06705 [Pseudogymnoascus sp. VKM F-4520 (FW-2644)]|nr:hypothetical protein V502_06705 [Pseudogymnoascus sp. VKM F-4520 (FW-2644)]
MAGYEVRKARIRPGFATRGTLEEEQRRHFSDVDSEQFRRISLSPVEQRPVPVAPPLGSRTRIEGDERETPAVGPGERTSTYVLHGSSSGMDARTRKHACTLRGLGVRLWELISPPHHQRLSTAAYQSNSSQFSEAIQRPTRTSIGTATIFRGRPIRESLLRFLFGLPFWKGRKGARTQHGVNLALSRILSNRANELYRWSTPRTCPPHPAINPPPSETPRGPLQKQPRPFDQQLPPLTNSTKSPDCRHPPQTIARHRHPPEPTIHCRVLLLPVPNPPNPSSQTQLLASKTASAPALALGPPPATKVLPQRTTARTRPACAARAQHHGTVEVANRTAPVAASLRAESRPARARPRRLAPRDSGSWVASCRGWRAVVGGELSWRGVGGGGGGVIYSVVSRYCGREGSGRDPLCFFGVETGERLVTGDW